MLPRKYLQTLQHHKYPISLNNSKDIGGAKKNAIF